MPDETSQLLRRMDMTERNQTDLAKSITALVQDVAELKLKDAVNAAREEARDEWRSRTEKRLNSIYGLGWWVLATFGSLTIAAIANLLYRGGAGVP